MVACLDKYKGKSRSSCPNVTDWPDAFGDADDIFCVTITSGLSGSYNSACAAKKRLVSAIEREGFSGGRISIGHCLNEAAAMQLKDMILEKFQGATVEIHRFGGLCSFYAEKGGVPVGFERG